MGDDIDMYADTRYTAEISNRMQVPDRITVAPSSGDAYHSHRDNMSQSSSTLSINSSSTATAMDMKVPDRILLGGSNTHVAGKNLPRELQLENSNFVGYPPMDEHVRVSTPPRSIRLDEVCFPTASEEISSPQHHGDGNNRRKMSSSTLESNDQSMYKDTSITISSGNVINDRENLSPWEEIQLLRRQMVKYNHRLMAVELENQQQQQREMVFTALVSAYFIGKIILWMSKSS